MEIPLSLDVLWKLVGAGMMNGKCHCLLCTDCLHFVSLVRLGTRDLLAINFEELSLQSD